MHLSAGDANGDTDAIVSSLVQVMLSPGCRTIAGMVWRILAQAVPQAATRKTIFNATGVSTPEGLQDLIQKEFVSMGYRFQTAHGTFDRVQFNLLWLCQSMGYRLIYRSFFS